MAHPTLRRLPAERLAAWLHLGPLGHLLGFLVDLGELVGRHLVRSARARLLRGGA